MRQIARGALQSMCLLGILITISWISHFRPTIEAEYMVMIKVSKRMIWLQHSLANLKVKHMMNVLK